MPRGQEYETLITEVRLATARMRADTERVSRRGFKNCFLDGISQMDEIDPKDPNLTTIALHTDELTAMKLPEMIMLYRKYNKQGLFSEDPSHFFQNLEKAGDFTYLIMGLKRSEVTQTKNTFEQITQVIGGDTPTVWQVAGFADVLLKGLGVRNYEQYFQELKRERWELNPSYGFKRAFVFGGMLYYVIKRYFESTTMTMLRTYLNQEREIVEKAGVVIPSFIQEFTNLLHPN